MLGTNPDFSAISLIRDRRSSGTSSSDGTSNMLLTLTRGPLRDELALSPLPGHERSRVPRGAGGREEPGTWLLVSAGPGGGFRLPVFSGVRAVHRVAGRAGHAAGVAEGDAELVGALGVLGDVDAGYLVLHRDPEAHRLVDDLAEDPGDGEGVEADRDRAEDLHPELRDTATVEQSLALPGQQGVSGQESQRHRAERAADQVYAHDVERVVEAEPVLD